MAISNKRDSAVGIATSLVKVSESCRLVAYPDPATGGKPWTNGWGATGATIVEGTTWTQEQADTDLAARVDRLAAKIYPLAPRATQMQIAAAIDFAYNCGMAALLGSTWFRKLKQGLITEAALRIKDWNKANGSVMAGLVVRRKRESKLLLGEITWQ